MEELKSLYEALELQNVHTYIQSGNVVFQSQNPDMAGLSKKIEASIEEHFGYFVSVVIRSKSELRFVLDHNPFLRERNEDITKLYVTFLSQTASQAALNELSSIADKYDELRALGKEIYLFCPHGYGRTKFSNKFFERKLKVPATTRNWKTVQRLYKIADEN